ncbi:phosphomannomutase CpsG [Enterobacter sp.]|uniref:phosphomannomutase CpsG n=1 Tax=Enterobacter sp. TaxID=42895 RepID=UPI00296E9725|nr:phosphomannomutase CpsG [Enterobacter sp.]
MDELTCFKAYDIRGEVGVTLTPEIVFRIGRAYAAWLQPRRVVIGADVRLSSDTLKMALAEGLRASGVDVIDIGMCGTEEIYFATRELAADGGIEITASHNPAQDNGMKLVREEARPISNDNGLLEIKALAQRNDFPPAARVGDYLAFDHRPVWAAHLLRYLTSHALRPLRVVVNPGHGTAGPALDVLEAALRARGVNVEFIHLYHQPDGRFPAGVPNPMLKENRSATRNTVRLRNADFGVAWDGDFDRCFFFDEHGDFIESYYLVGLFAEHFLRQSPGSTVLLDPRLTWNTQEVVAKCGGRAVIGKTGHAFIKARMREEDAIYGGEMSGHHYFRDFGYCDSGMIPFILMLSILGQSTTPLSHYMAQAQQRFPVSGEINLTVASPEKVIERIAAHYSPACVERDSLDGLSMAFSDWRFNLRASNTEPLLRLNVETRGNPERLAEKTAELQQLIAHYQA